MFDFKFDWKPDMACGVEEIDTQHKQLFRIGRDIEQLIQTDCIGIKDEQLLDIVCQLRDFCAYHFYEEESLMDSIQYSKSELHKKEHEKITKRLTGMSMPALKKEPLKELIKIREEVQHQIFEHVLGLDMEFAKEYLTQQKVSSNQKSESESLDNSYGLKLMDLDVATVYLYKEQSNKGRMLLIDREKSKGISKIPSLVRDTFFNDVTRSMKALNAAYSPDSIDCAYFGDVCLETHMHIIPKYKNDEDWGKALCADPGKYYPSLEELEEIAEKIRTKLK